MLNLLLKDFKLLFAGKGSVKKNILSALGNFLLIAVFLVIETFIFSTILKKIRNYNNATIPFLTLFLFIVSCVVTLLDTVQANKLFFNDKDTEQLIIRPISNAQIVLSKLIFLFLTHFFTSLLLVYPLIVSYGNIVGKTSMYYYAGLFYPVLSIIFEAGIALFFVYPLKIAGEFLKKYTFVQFFVSIIVMFGACFLYNAVLTGFMNLVVNNDVSALFTVESIANMSNVRKYLIPATFYSDIFFSELSSQLVPYLLLALGVFVLGLTIAVAAFHYFRSVKIIGKKAPSRTKAHVVGPKRALLKKELILLFKDSTNIFSFTGLLIVQPFLVYVILNSLNSVFTTGAFAYYMAALPELIPLIDMLIVMFFTLIINSGANEYIQIEKNNVRTIKTLPVSEFTQVLIKVGVPFLLSVCSLLLTTLILLFFEIVSFTTFLFATVISILLLLTFDVISLKEELKIERYKTRSSAASTAYSYLMPLLFFVGAIIGCLLGLELFLACLVGAIFFTTLALPQFIHIKRDVKNAFLDMELVN